MKKPFMKWAWSKLVEEDDMSDDDIEVGQEGNGIPIADSGTGTPSELKAQPSNTCPNAVKRRKAQKPKRKKAKGFVNTHIFVDGLCCASEVPVIERIVKPMEGVSELCINVAGRTITVRHDARVVEEDDIVAALNEAALGARVHKLGKGARIKRVPARILLAAALVVAAALSFQAGLLVAWRIFALTSVALTAPKVVVRLFSGIKRGRLDIHTLILVACFGVICMQLYCEAATVLVLFSLADYIESRITVRARGVIEEVLALRPEEAELPTGDHVPVAEVPVGTVVVVRQGDLIPLDGVVTMGTLLVDESALTGEAVPVPKAVEAQVSAGTTNISGFALVKTTAESKDSTVSRLVKTVEEAQALRSETERSVELFARFYTPLILSLAAALLTVPFLVDRERAASGEFVYMTLVLLVIACPCALVISTPVTYLSGIACGATHNMLVRGGVHLETLGAVDMVALDKTGTLTEGAFRLRELHVVAHPGRSMDEGTLLRWVASVEARSSHPLAAALVAAAKRRGFEPSSDVSHYEESPGEGVLGTVEGICLAVGNERMAERLGWTKQLPEQLPVDRWAREGSSVLWVGTAGLEGRLLAVLSMGDVPRPEAADAMEQLRQIGVSAIMLTGDGRGAADAVGQVVGVQEIRAALTPEGKIAELMELRTRSHTVCMVGDGVNDVPALAASSVGVAMGAAGKAAALQAADVVLLDSNLLQLAFALRLGRCVLRKVRQNIGFAIVCKVVFVVLTLQGCTSLLAAIVVDVGSMMLVVLNGSSVMLMGRERRRAGLPAAVSLEAVSSQESQGQSGFSQFRCLDACCAAKDGGLLDTSDLYCPLCHAPFGQAVSGIDGLCEQCSGQQKGFGSVSIATRSTGTPSDPSETHSVRELSPDPDLSDTPEVTHPGLRVKPNALRKCASQWAAEGDLEQGACPEID